MQIQIQITHWLHTVDTAGGGWLTFAVGTVCHSLCDVATQSYLCQYLYLYFICIPFRFAFALVFVFSLVFVFAVGTVWCRGTLRSSRMSLAHNLLTINQTTKAQSSKLRPTRSTKYRLSQFTTGNIYIATLIYLLVNYWYIFCWWSFIFCRAVIMSDWILNWKDQRQLKFRIQSWNEQAAKKWASSGLNRKDQRQLKSIIQS